MIDIWRIVRYLVLYNLIPNGWVFMPLEPTPSPHWPEPQDDEPQWEDEFWDPAEIWDPDEIDAFVAEADQAAADQAAAQAHIAAMGQTSAMAAVAAGRRGPGQKGSARVLPGVCDGPGGGFATGQALDVAPGSTVVMSHIEKAAGDADSFDGTSDDELIGIIAAADRTEASNSALKHAAVAALIRRRPAKVPGTWEEYTERELASLLAESRHAAGALLDLAHDLATKLPGTYALFRSGVISRYKAQIIASGCQPLDADEARAAEALVLGRAGGLTPGGLRSAIAKAVIEVNAEKAKKRREAARKHARVEVFAEFSGNAALEAHELPMAEAAAMDQRISWWAGQLGKSGAEGTHDQLRARALIDLVLGRDSRPGHAGESLSAVPAGFAGHLNLTIPAATVLGLADRPGEIATMGPIDPWLARDLATAAARNPKTTWCVTVTGKDGHAVAHGCARPDPKRRPGPGPPAGTGFTLTPDSRAGPPGSHATWHLHTPGPGPDLILTLEPLTTDPCDHRHQTAAHDPGVKLRHLTQIRYTTCTAPGCQRPASACDYEHTTPHEAGGRTCLCNGDPKCRYDHRVKQHPKWTVARRPDGTLRWTTPTGRSYTTEPTRYPI
jgi:Domain of unknown function (DUF222)